MCYELIVNVLKPHISFSLRKEKSRKIRKSFKTVEIIYVILINYKTIFFIQAYK